MPKEKVKTSNKSVGPKLLKDKHSVSGVNNPDIHLSEIDRAAHSSDFKK